VVSCLILLINLFDPIELLIYELNLIPVSHLPLGLSCVRAKGMLGCSVKETYVTLSSNLRKFDTFLLTTFDHLYREFV
jgi:hypothetical protein